MSLQKYKIPGLGTEILYWIDHNLANYLTKHEENYQEIEHIVDFLNSDDAPKRLKKMSYEEANLGSKKWVEKLIKKASEVVETEEDTEVILNFDDGFSLVKLIGKAAFEREGSIMRHCVASYFEKSDSAVYSLRDSDNNSHCTMEIVKNQETDTISQIKGKGNGSIHPRYVDMVIKSLKYFGKSVMSEDLLNLGYADVSKELREIIEKEFTGAKWLTFDNQKFFYKYSKLVKAGEAR